MRHLSSRIALLLIVALTSAAIAWAEFPVSPRRGVPQEVSKLEDPPWIKEVATERIVYVVPGMEKIKARKDLVYKRAGDSDLNFSNHAEGQHGFDVLDDNDRTREIIRRTLNFIKAHT